MIPLSTVKPAPPTRGYILPLWESRNDYRATARAYLQREDTQRVENENGFHYSLTEIENALIK
jgi:hypothetical protein